MKYTKQIVFLLFINLIIVFLSIFTGNLTRKLEITNQEIKQIIEKEKKQLTINRVEFSFYNNPSYLKQLHNIYFSFDDNNPEKKIISFSSISINNTDSLVLVDLKSK